MNLKNGVFVAAFCLISGIAQASNNQPECRIEKKCVSKSTHCAAVAGEITWGITTEDSIACIATNGTVARVKEMHTDISNDFNRNLEIPISCTDNPNEKFKGCLEYKAISQQQALRECEDSRSQTLALYDVCNP